MDCFGAYFTHVQTCNVTRVQNATEWIASVHTLHMSKPNVTRVQSATEWIAWVWRCQLPKNANFKVELAKICWPSSLPAAPKKEAANSTCRNTIAVKSTKHKLSLKTRWLLPTRDLVSASVLETSSGHPARHISACLGATTCERLCPETMRDTVVCHF